MPDDELQFGIGDYAENIVEYADESLTDLEDANIIEEEIDDFTKRMEDNHIERLGKGVCNSKAYR